MENEYTASASRYNDMTYRRCGKSGLMLPVISLGLWHNFGEKDDLRVATQILCQAFDSGITHFDLANNYGPPPGSAESFFGKVLRNELSQYRDEMIVSTKAGHQMWEGPYGDFASKKHLLASLDQSLKRMALDYVDIFYSHRPDPDTPIEETMEALAHAVKQGKALYVGLSKYSTAQTEVALQTLESLGVKCLIHQHRYSMFERGAEDQKLFQLLEKEGVGNIAFSPLAQGILTNKYLEGVPEDSRIVKGSGFLRSEHLTDDKLEKVQRLNQIAESRGQTMAQLALVWVLRASVTSVLIGVSKVRQLEDNLKVLDKLDLTDREANEIEEILS